MELTIRSHKVTFDAAGQGTPLLLMHAFPLNRGMFGPQKQALQETAQLLTFDVPGAGESEFRTVSMDDIADIAAAVLDSERIDKAVIGGVSMGGYAAFSFVRRHADRLQGLVLANTRAAADSEEARAGRREMAALAIQKGPAEVADRLIPRLLGETSRKNQPALVEQIRRTIESVAPESIAMLLQALGDREDSNGLLMQIAVPTLVIAGQEDALAPPAEAKAWAAKIPQSRYVEVEDAGHLVNLERPEAFNTEVSNFLRQINGA